MSFDPKTCKINSVLWNSGCSLHIQVYRDIVMVTGKFTTPNSTESSTAKLRDLNMLKNAALSKIGNVCKA